jgi:hypothetical protein
LLSVDRTSLHERQPDKQSETKRGRESPREKEDRVGERETDRAIEKEKEKE